MSRIQIKFQALADQNRKGLIPFITAGDPNLSTTVQLMHALVRGGADIIELGMPFSDPMADGPVIQRASERALKNGVGLTDVLQCVREFRAANHDTPVVLMGYANPIECMGMEKFAAEAAHAGVDGALVVDYPPEECAAYLACMKQHGIDVIFLLAPTSTQERIQQVAHLARGYVYYVSLKGVTGNHAVDIADVDRMLANLKQHIPVPIAVGFGIRDGNMAKRIAQVADAVVIGSRIIQVIEQEIEQKIGKTPSHPDQARLILSVQKLVNEIRLTMDA
jgi:tryptophan synthase alpha chain